MPTDLQTIDTPFRVRKRRHEYHNDVLTVYSVSDDRLLATLYTARLPEAVAERLMVRGLLVDLQRFEDDKIEDRFAALKMRMRRLGRSLWTNGAIWRGRSRRPTCGPSGRCPKCWRNTGG